MRFVKLAAAHLPVLLLLLALLSPTVGILADHHFAERQPDHLHAGLYSGHTHFFYERHVHYEGVAPSNAGGQQSPTAIYNYDGALAIAIGVAMFDVGADALFEFEPTSLFVLPLPGNTPARARYVSPAERPPPHLL